jgi:hypothetical protein
MPSPLQPQTGRYGAFPDTMSPQVGWEIKDPAVLPCAGSQGPVADTLLTTCSSSSRSTGQARTIAAIGATEAGHCHARL